MRYRLLSVIAVLVATLFTPACTKDISPTEREEQQGQQEEKKDEGIHVKGIHISPEAQTICVGDTLQMLADITPADATDKTVFWNVTDPDVAKISQDGLIVALKAGSTKVIAKTRDNEQMAYSEISVVLPPESISLDIHELTLIVGDSFQLIHHIYPIESSIKTVTWTSSDQNILDVSGNGEISAKSAGHASVTVTVDGTQICDSCSVEVRQGGIIVDSIVLSPDYLFIYEGQEASLTAEAYPKNATYINDFQWESSNPAIVAVDNNGRISAKSAGNCTIKVTSAEGYASAECIISVKADQLFHTGYNIENSSVSMYLDAAEAEYSNTDSISIVNKYCKTASTYKESNREDIPTNVKVSWFGMADKLEYSLLNGSTQNTITFQSTTTNTHIWNLVPDNTYIYKVNNSVRTSGSLNVTGRRRIIRISEKYSNERGSNFRDLGGIRTTDGKLLKYGMIFRGSSIDKLSNSEKAIMLDQLGIKLDVDLRDALIGKWVSPLGIDLSNQEYGIKIEDLANAKKITKTLTDIMTYVSEGKPVYIHCQTGSDRTGYICMLIEALLGAPLSECEIDYELSSFAAGVTNGIRAKRSGMALEFVNMFVKGKHSNYFDRPGTYDEVPQTVEDYVVNTLGISQNLVESFRQAMLK